MRSHVRRARTYGRKARARGGPIGALAAAGALALAFGAGSARAATSDLATQTSANWAGYAVTSAPTTFTRVLASWTQPAATCTAGSATYAAFWVGLGGFADGSKALEQTGTEADCSVAGVATYSAWYELVPAGPVKVKLAVQAGDAISAAVTVIGRNVYVRVVDSTRGTVFTKRLRMTSPDLSSAEWIAEAPSACSNFGCRALALTNFGTVSFTGATATGNGHTGTIGDPAWTATAVTLQGGADALLRSRFASAAPVADAVPAALSGDGGSFAVTWQQAEDAATP
jgi:peptidase A4-like protein